MSEGVAQWLSAQGFGGRQSWTRILPLGCSGSCLELPLVHSSQDMMPVKPDREC